MLVDATGRPPGAVRQALEQSPNDLRVALLPLVGSIDPDGARELLAQNGGDLREAIAALGRRS